jgi:hypothetical protein
MATYPSTRTTHPPDPSDAAEEARKFYGITAPVAAAVEQAVTTAERFLSHLAIGDEASMGGGPDLDTGPEWGSPVGRPADISDPHVDLDLDLDLGLFSDDEDVEAEPEEEEEVEEEEQEEARVDVGMFNYAAVDPPIQCTYPAVLACHEGHIIPSEAPLSQNDVPGGGTACAMISFMCAARHLTGKHLYASADYVDVIEMGARLWAATFRDAYDHHAGGPSFESVVYRDVRDVFEKLAPSAVDGYVHDIYWGWASDVETAAAEVGAGATTLAEALQACSHPEKSGIVTANAASISVHHSDVLGGWFVFDSHPHTEGTLCACMYVVDTFDALSDLVRARCRLYPNAVGVGFEVTALWLKASNLPKLKAM